MEKMISVVVCTYNQQETIARTLDSILAQQCSWPYEIIIGEDRSSDETLAICRAYQERYPDIIRIKARETNIGLVDNYYDCLLSARGKYIADVAGDDEWCDPLKLEKELAVMEQHEEVVLVHTDYRRRIEETGELKSAGPYPFPKGITPGKELVPLILRCGWHMLVHLCTSLYRNETFRECYAQYREFFDGKNYPTEDLQLTTLLATKGSFAFLDEVTLNYSINTRSLTNTLSYEKRWYFTEGTIRLRYDLASRLSLLDHPEVKASLCMGCYEMMMHAFRLYDKKKREQTLCCARQWHVTYDGKLYLVRFVTSWWLLWKLALGVRQIVLACKRLLRINSLYR